MRLLTHLLIISISMPIHADILENWYPDSPPRSGYAPLSQQGFNQLENQFLQIVSALPRLPQRSAESRWQLKILDHRYIALQQRENHGGGHYLFNPAAKRPIYLQAPHRVSDRNTGRIVLRLFQRNHYRGAGWNSLHRRSKGLKGPTESDLAHIPLSPFTAMGRAIAMQEPEARIIQLHGFNQTRRKSVEGASADIIISSASNWPSSETRLMALCLQQSQLGVVRLYPNEVRELGGTTNNTAKALQRIGFSGFIHLELSAPLRQRLLKETDLFDRFAQCLEQ